MASQAVKAASAGAIRARRGASSTRAVRKLQANPSEDDDDGERFQCFDASALESKLAQSVDRIQPAEIQLQRLERHEPAHLRGVRRDDSGAGCRGDRSDEQRQRAGSRDHHSGDLAG